ncbi:MAG: hypothetical protein RL708_495 [Bacteroidota bacterium]|jgi:hypothetical protein
MLKTLGFTLILVLSFIKGFCLVTEIDSLKLSGTKSNILNKNALQTEFFANSLFFSLGYERKFLVNKYNFSAVRMGLGLSPIFDFTFILPIEFTTSFGKKNYFLEIGVGLTKTFIPKQTSSFNFFSTADVRHNVFENYLFSRIGLRFEKTIPNSKVGFVGKIGFTPFYEYTGRKNINKVNFKEFVPAFGISGGVTF